MKLYLGLRQRVFDFDRKGFPDDILGVPIENRMAGTLFQRQIEQIHRRASLFDRQAENDLAFPTVELRFERIPFSLVHIGPQGLSQPPIVGSRRGPGSNGHMLERALLNSRRGTGRDKLLDFLSGLNRSL